MGYTQGGRVGYNQGGMVGIPWWVSPPVYASPAVYTLYMPLLPYTSVGVPPWCTSQVYLRGVPLRCTSGVLHAVLSNILRRRGGLCAERRLFSPQEETFLPAETSLKGRRNPPQRSPAQGCPEYPNLSEQCSNPPQGYGPPFHIREREEGGPLCAEGSP